MTARSRARAEGTQRRSMLQLFLAMFLLGLTFHIYAAPLPVHLNTLGFSAATVGTLVGAAGITQFIGAFIAGPAVDRFGARAIVLSSAAMHLLVAVGFQLVAGAVAIFGLRVIQGLAVAASHPAMYSYVPRLVPGAAPVAMASLGMFANVAMAIAPPIGMMLLTDVSPGSLFIVAAVAAAAAFIVMLPVPAPAPQRRPFRPSMDRAWLPPIFILFLTIVPSVAVMTFGPVAFVAADMDPSLWFSPFAIAILASRVPAAMLGNRLGLVPLLMAAYVLGAAGVALLIAGSSAEILVASGTAIGISTGMCHPAMLALLSIRSDEARRGTALSYFTAMWGLGSIVGGIAGGFVVDGLGFSALLVVVLPTYLLAAGVTLADRGSGGLRRGRGPDSLEDAWPANNPRHQRGLMGSG